MGPTYVTIILYAVAGTRRHLAIKRETLLQTAQLWL